jgi:hypothetical protein
MRASVGNSQFNLINERGGGSMNWNKRVLVTKWNCVRSQLFSVDSFTSRLAMRSELIEVYVVFRLLDAIWTESERNSRNRRVNYRGIGGD